jgi:translation initiation factor 2A
MSFSPDGQLFAWCNGEALVVAKLDPNGHWDVKWKSEEARRTVYIKFSPKSNFLASWEVRMLEPF